MAAALSVDVEGWRREFDELMLRVGARFARGRAAAADGRVLPAHAPHPVPLALLVHVAGAQVGKVEDGFAGGKELAALDSQAAAGHSGDGQLIPLTRHEIRHLLTGHSRQLAVPAAHLCCRGLCPHPEPVSSDTVRSLATAQDDDRLALASPTQNR